MKTDLIKREGAWLLQYNRIHFNIFSDRLLEKFASDPNADISYINEDMTSGNKISSNHTTFESFCVDARERGVDMIEVYSNFFYGDTLRFYGPDDELTIAVYKRMYDIATKYGID